MSCINCITLGGEIRLQGDVRLALALIWARGRKTRVNMQAALEGGDWSLLWFSAELPVAASAEKSKSGDEFPHSKWQR